MKLEGFLYLNPPSKIAIRHGMRLYTFMKGFPNIEMPCSETEAKKSLSNFVPSKSIISLDPGAEKHETEAKRPPRSWLRFARVNLSTSMLRPRE